MTKFAHALLLLIAIGLYRMIYLTSAPANGPSSNPIYSDLKDTTASQIAYRPKSVTVLDGASGLRTSQFDPLHKPSP